MTAKREGWRLEHTKAVVSLKETGGFKFALNSAQKKR
jgi:hypothetical protein